MTLDEALARSKYRIAAFFGARGEVLVRERLNVVPDMRYNWTEYSTSGAVLLTGDTATTDYIEARYLFPSWCAVQDFGHWECDEKGE